MKLRYQFVALLSCLVMLAIQWDFAFQNTPEVEKWLTQGITYWLQFGFFIFLGQALVLIVVAVANRCFAKIKVAQGNSYKIFCVYLFWMSMGLATGFGILMAKAGLSQVSALAVAFGGMFVLIGGYLISNKIFSMQ